MCRRCGVEFPARPNRAASESASSLLWNDPFRSPWQKLDNITQVKCPGCSHVFSSDDVVVFGVIRSKTLKLGFVALIVVWLVGLSLFFALAWLDATTAHH